MGWWRRPSPPPRAPLPSSAAGSVASSAPCAKGSPQHQEKQQYQQQYEQHSKNIAPQPLPIPQQQAENAAVSAAAERLAELQFKRARVEDRRRDLLEKQEALAAAKVAAASQPQGSPDVLAKSFRAAATGSCKDLLAESRSVLNLAGAKPSPALQLAEHSHDESFHEKSGRSVAFDVSFEKSARSVSPSLGSFRSFKHHVRSLPDDEDDDEAGDERGNGVQLPARAPPVGAHAAALPIGAISQGGEQQHAEDADSPPATAGSPARVVRFEGSPLGERSLQQQMRRPPPSQPPPPPPPPPACEAPGPGSDDMDAKEVNTSFARKSQSFVRRSALAWRARALGGRKAERRTERVGAGSRPLGGPPSLLDQPSALSRVHADVIAAVAPSLSLLDLSRCAWRPEEVAAFASELLPTLVSCAKLQLSGSHVGSVGAGALAGALRGNRTIRLASLYLDDCQLGDDGVALIAG